MVDRILSSVLSLNGLCNSRCIYCNSWKSNVTGPSKEMWLKVINQLVSIHVQYLSFSGGEPLLRQDLPTLVEHATELNITSQVLTNGILLGGRVLKDSIESGLEGICISLDTLDETTYRQVRGVKLSTIQNGLYKVFHYREAHPNLKISVKCVLSRYNLSQVDTLLEFANKNQMLLGFQPFHPAFIENAEVKEAPSCKFEHTEAIDTTIRSILNFKRSTGLVINEEAYLQNFARFMVTGQPSDDFQCEAANWVVVVDHDLNLKPCWMLPSVGTVDTSSLLDLWTGPAMNTMRAKMRTMRCKNCWLTCHSDLHINERMDLAIKDRLW
jgi:MoaA/NifB/PqqE/SkfB family radical SAM enzyme